ncbi:ABC transporter substrate-binding protein [Salinisphaera orenii MK-B5]|uniref:ABC transporter substrate-binding protein n=1 Tax=Salinisphaera orenii MK-B5 TaxID=856730 RepID=A0A423PSF0_9GAMM|nr:iron-siderophore ABC transporter substrate-binding protein [Salinisphaera orenii]ROO28482.1 ABC transporter substrate-binding protein [Salinisphaera orenii MK-B5]
MLITIRKTGLCLALTALLAVSLPGAARMLDTRYGTIEIDGTPERVVTLHEGALDAAVALGTTPVAAVATRGGDGVARYMDGRVDDIAIVGTARETHIEAVVAQRPDVILAAATLPESQYRLLSNIAPTVVPKGSNFAPDAWQAHTRLYARALNATDRAEALINNFDTRTAAIATQVPEAAEATLARWMPQGPLVMADIIFASRVLAAAGFTVNDAGVVAEGRPHSDPLSLENLDRIDSDWLFLATLNADGENALAQARSSPGFERLDVVQRDRVVAVDGQLWTSASGPIAANAILDDIAAALDLDRQP